MEQLPLIKGLPPLINTEDPVLRERLEKLDPPKGFKAFARVSEGGLHEVGIERSDGKPKRPGIIALPGFCHGNWSYIKLIEELVKIAKEKQNSLMEFAAVSPPGEPQSKPWKRPLAELEMEDYLMPYQDYLLEKDRDSVLMGHSLGGLQAQILALRMKGLANVYDRVRESVKGLILINSVKPSNLCRRTYSLVERDGSEFDPGSNGKWILEDLFNKEFPTDIGWIMERLGKVKGSNNVIDDYQGEHGVVDPAKMDIPVLEFFGTEDRGQTSGVSESFDDVFIKEQEALAKGRRATLSEFFLKGGECAFAKSIGISGGSHNSLILGEHAKSVAEKIAEEYSMFR